MRTTRTLAAVVAALAVVGFGLGVRVGVSRGRSQGYSAHAQTAQAEAAREQRVLQWVVETNPNATIRDFLDFPRYVIDTAQRYGFDYRLPLAIALKESGMNPRAVGAHGEIGLMQLLPSTGALVAKRLKYPFTPPERGRGGYETLGTLGDAKANMLLGMEYLSWQIDRFGVTPTALRAYNRAPQNAREVRSQDTYAEAVSENFLVLVHRL